MLCEYRKIKEKIIVRTIERSDILQLLSKAAFNHQDMAEFDSLAYKEKFAERKNLLVEGKEVYDSVENVIYTHDEAAIIVELFENLLDAHNFKVPSPEDGEREADNEAKLYGSVYSDLLDDVETTLENLLNKHKTRTTIITGMFSGTI